MMLYINHITKRYRRGSDVFTALDDVSFEIDKGDFVTITGHSGSGKSTLLHTIGGLIQPDNGTVTFNGTSIYGLKKAHLDSYRRNKVGFIFQQFHLLPYLTVLENIRLASHTVKQIRKIDRYLGECSLEEQKDKYPSELSVGEKQRTAFIRAIISDPELLLADEPTGNLDPDNSAVIIDLITEYNRNGGTVLLVSHDQPSIPNRTKSLKLQKGKIIS